MKFQNIAIVHGDTNVIDVAIVRDGLPVDITGASFWMTAKTLPTNDDSTVMFQCTSAAGDITILNGNPTAGIIRITVAPSKTLGLAYSDLQGVYDIQMKESGGAITTTNRGTITIYYDLTRATS